MSTEVEPVKLVSPGQVPESKLMVTPVGAAGIGTKGASMMMSLGSFSL